MSGRGVSAVFLGGGLGACARALFLQVSSPWHTGLPLSVLVVNLVGSFLLGAVFVFADEAELMRTTTRLFVAVGILGGFTTFSTFGWGADQLVRNGHAVMATVYVVASLVGGVLAVAAGIETGRVMLRAVDRISQGTHAGRDRPQGASPARDMGLIETEDREDGASA